MRSYQLAQTDFPLHAIFSPLMSETLGPSLKRRPLVLQFTKGIHGSSN